MSLSKYKKIENNRGFFIEDRDSKIFEREFYKSLYGEGENDVIKFTLYDVNENLLPQEGYGDVRYIHSSSFGDYFRKIKGTENQTNNQPFEYEINVDKLIQEAGYKVGIFNVEILLINDRVGSNHDGDRLWIHEISPSRTEIRVLPLQVQNENLQNRLDESYSALINNKIFLDDIREVLPTFIDSVDSSDIETIITQNHGESFLRELKTQFFPNGGFNLMVINILESFKKSLEYVVDHKNSTIGDTNFGKTLDSQSPVSLDIKSVIESKLRESIDHHLPRVSDRTDVNFEYNKSKFDIKTQNLLRKIKSRTDSDSVPTLQERSISIDDDTYRETERDRGDVEFTETKTTTVPDEIIPSTPTPPKNPVRDKLRRNRRNRTGNGIRDEGTVISNSDLKIR